MASSLDTDHNRALPRRGETAENVEEQPGIDDARRSIGNGTEKVIGRSQKEAAIPHEIPRERESNDLPGAVRHELVAASPAALENKGCARSAPLRSVLRLA